MKRMNFRLSTLAERLGRMSFLGSRRDHFLVNLSSRYRAYVAPLRIGLIGICALLSLAILWSCAQALVAYQGLWNMQAELERVRQQDQQLLAEARQEEIDISDAALQQLPAEVALANQLLEKRTFSWTKFLTGLEQAIPSRLALSSIRLDTGGTIVHLTGTAISLEDITAFTVGLQDHPIFKDPVLAHHRVETNGLVEFDVTLQYRRDGI